MENKSLPILKMYSRQELTKGIGNSVRYYIPWIDKLVSNKSFHRYLKPLGKSLQDYYDRFFLNIIVIRKNRPKCPICSEECRFVNISTGYGSTCGNLDCAHKMNSEHFKDKIYRDYHSKRTSEGNFRVHNDPIRGPIIREKMSKGLKKVWNNPNHIFNSNEYKEVISKKKILEWGDPNSGLRMADRTKAGLIISNLWKDSDSKYNSKENKQRLSKHFKEVLRKHWNNPNSAYHTEEYHNFRSELSRKIANDNWSEDGSWRTKSHSKKMSDHMHYVYDHPEEYPDFHEKRKKFNSEGGAFGKIFSNPDKYSKAISLIKKNYENGGVFGQMYRNLKDYPNFKNASGWVSKSEWYESNKCGKYFCHSTWELMYCRFLDQDDSVVNYSNPSFSIPYQQGDCTDHRYLPDFFVTYVDSRKEIIEIKPSLQVNWEKNILKFVAAEKYCQENNMTFKVITEKDFDFKKKKK